VSGTVFKTVRAPVRGLDGSTPSLLRQRAPGARSCPFRPWGVHGSGMNVLPSFGVPPAEGSSFACVFAPVLGWLDGRGTTTWIADQPYGALAVAIAVALGLAGLALRRP
jgi:hypothetical protein